MTTHLVVEALECTVGDDQCIVGDPECGVYSICEACARALDQFFPTEDEE